MRTLFGLLFMALCLIGQAAEVTVKSGSGNSIKVSAGNTIADPDNDDTLLAAKWPALITASVTPSPASGWVWKSTSPSPTQKQFDGNPATTLSISVTFVSLATKPNGEPDEEETLTAFIAMPKIDLSITNPDGEKLGKDEFKSKDGIVVMLPETSEEDEVYSTIEISAISPSALGGNYQFSWDASKLKVFEDQQGTKPVEQTKDYDATRQWTFYVRGSKFSDARDDQEFKVNWISGDKKTTITNADILRLTVVKIEMTLHAPGTKVAPGQNLERPSQKDQPYAGILVANNDDDDARGSASNPKRDNDDETLGSADNDLVEVELDFLPHGMDKGTLKVEFNNQTIRAFTDQGSPLQTSDLEINLNSPQGKLSGLKQKKITLFLEGLEPHKAKEELKFVFKRKDTIKEDKALLLPVEIIDESNGQVITDKAWIKAHTDGSNVLPQMPKLKARIVGAPHDWQVDWKLESRYPRRDGRDNTDVPKTGVAIKAGDEFWDIYQAIQDGTVPKFFGGDWTVRFTIHAGSSTTNSEIKFKVLGENPDDAQCKAHITASQGIIWYAWAIAKHESADSAGFYNQFANGKSDGTAGAHGAKGEPFYSPDEGDGWGLFQRDGTGGGIDTTTEETWSWDGNMRGFLQNEYPVHLGIANNYVNSVKNSNPGTFEEPQFTIKGRVISGRDVLALTWYNGRQGRSNEQMLHFDPNKLSGERWTLNLPDAPGEDHPPGTKYVDLILDAYNGG